MSGKRLFAAALILGIGIWISGCNTGIGTPSPSTISTPTVLLTPRPGLVLRGKVRLDDSRGLEGVKIFRALASYDGVQVAVTDSEGSYQSEFQFIPGDEMIRAWAELPGYILLPEKGASEQREYYWRHYYGYEERTLNFIARPSLK
jgi:hypothetical protein